MLKTAMTDNPFFRATTPADPSTSNPVDPLAAGGATQPLNLNTSPPANLAAAQPVIPPVSSDTGNAPLNDLSQAMTASPTIPSSPVSNQAVADVASVPTTTMNEIAMPASEGASLTGNIAAGTTSLVEPIIPAQEPVVEASSANLPTIPEILAMPAATESQTPAEAVTTVSQMPETNNVIQSETAVTAPISDNPAVNTTSMETASIAPSIEAPAEDNMLNRANESSVAPVIEASAAPETVNSLATESNPVSETQINPVPVVAPLASPISEMPSTPGPIEVNPVTVNPPESLMPQQPAEANSSPMPSATTTVEQPLAAPVEVQGNATPPTELQPPLAPIAETITPAVTESMPAAVNNNSEVKPATPATTAVPPADGKMKNLLLLLGLLIVGIIALVLGIIVASSQ